MSSADVPKADPTYYVTQVAFSTLLEGDEIRGHGTVVPEACVPGTEALRTSVILLWADVLAGAAAGLAINPRIPLTLDLEVQVRRPFAPGSEVHAEARIVRAGRSVVVTEATFGDGTDPEPLAIAVATFVPSPDTSHVFDGGFPIPVFPDDARLTQPLAERLSCRVLEPGVVEMPRRLDALNAVGAIQGGAVATALEEAAASLLPRAGPPRVAERPLPPPRDDRAGAGRGDRRRRPADGAPDRHAPPASCARLATARLAGNL